MQVIVRLCYNAFIIAVAEEKRYMPDLLEIEIKFWLPDPDKMRTQLNKLGAVSHGQQFEVNIRLDDEQKTLTKSHRVLRLRKAHREDQTINLLTVKTPGSTDETDLSVRREIELEVSDAKTLLSAFEVLGFAPYWQYEKRREIFLWEDVEIVIDELPFGWFMELEGSSQAIRTACGQLGLDLNNGLVLSYAHIFEYICGQLDTVCSDLTFEAFKEVAIPESIYEGLHLVEGD